MIAERELDVAVLATGLGEAGLASLRFDHRRDKSLPYAAYACVDTWLTDFRADPPNIDIPLLAMHGTADRGLPVEATAQRLPSLIKDVQLVIVEGGPHNFAWTHSEEVNRALLDFLAT